MDVLLLLMYECFGGDMHAMFASMCACVGGLFLKMRILSSC